MQTATQFTSATDISLRPVPHPVWQKQFEFLLNDPFLSRKYCRRSRLADKLSHVEEFLPELLQDSTPRKTVIDIGPGPGEFLEWCRLWGYPILGVDAANGAGGMGQPYLELSQLLTERQQIPMEYCGFETWLQRSPAAVPSDSVSLINSQGSIEQACSRFLNGVPHESHHDCRQLKWRKGAELDRFFANMMNEFARCLISGGRLLIYANGAANTRVYQSAIEAAAKDTGQLRLALKRKRLHKWVKV